MKNVYVLSLHEGRVYGMFCMREGHVCGTFLTNDRYVLSLHEGNVFGKLTCMWHVLYEARGCGRFCIKGIYMVRLV